MPVWVNQNFSQVGYLAVGLSMLAEGLTLPCPALFILLLAGAACALGKLSLGPVIAVAALAYTLGSLGPYYVGNHLSALEKMPWLGRFIEPSLQALNRVEFLFQRHGEKMVALSRPFWIGNLVSYFAGLYRMPYRKFLLYTFFGILGWTVVVVSMGCFFSSNLPRAYTLIRQYSGLGFLFLSFLAALWAVFKVLPGMMNNK